MILPDYANLGRTEFFGKDRRAGIFADYRLRVRPVTRDYGLTERAEAPKDLRDVHDEKHPR
jgi:hypothetical protein